MIKITCTENDLEHIIEAMNGECDGCPAEEACKADDTKPCASLIREAIEWIPEK